MSLQKYIYKSLTNNSKIISCFNTDLMSPHRIIIKFTGTWKKYRLAGNSEQILSNIWKTEHNLFNILHIFINIYNFFLTNAFNNWRLLYIKNVSMKLQKLIGCYQSNLISVLIVFFARFSSLKWYIINKALLFVHILNDCWLWTVKT